ncbi:MAG: hypothetical protein HYT03_02215 [Candidatus Harrisonbacteria bacterium]|nr:hypothetical protein [Candidatus Harrisonbacteria bacterium]
MQGHYNQHRDAGGDHAMYAIVNDLSDATAKELRRNYASTHPPVSKKKIKQFNDQFKKEADEAKLRDDLEWLTGTGRYGQ